MCWRQWLWWWRWGKGRWWARTRRPWPSLPKGVFTKAATAAATIIIIIADIFLSCIDINQSTAIFCSSIFSFSHHLQ
jgi:hypothetical protein